MFNLKQWRYIDSGTASAAWNMAVDEALLYRRAEHELPVLRLYGWTPALSFGRFSDAAASVDLPRLGREGVGAVRRITGGGILVHGGDLSYALILPRSFIGGRGVKESYRLLCAFVIRLYETLGLQASFACDLHLKEAHSPVCLAGREACDIIVAGKKLGGSAQRHTRHAFLQHGSIPLRLERERFEPLFSGPSGLKEAASLEGMGVRLSAEALKAALLEAFVETFGARFAETGLRPEEETFARTLLRRKYENEGWNIRAEDPVFVA